ncbi:MAG: hypothetical protein NTX52_03575 [Planctomycetota bacterium]|nr:hypothetical protein [Planctomycetota bacterium]
MGENAERRIEKRLRYYWPIWFAEDFDDTLSQGQMADVSSKAAAFTCYPDSCPSLGEQITARFSVPRYGPDDSFDMANFTRSGCVTRVDDVSKFLRRVAVQFAKPLPFRPGEQGDDGTESQSEEELDSVSA